MNDQASSTMQLLREKLDGVAHNDNVLSSIVTMWNYVLDYHQSEESGKLDCRFVASPTCDAIPYIPVDLESLGIILKADSLMVDLGCFGGYGLYDFVRRRENDSQPVPVMVGFDVHAGSVDISQQLAGVWAKKHMVSFCRASASELPIRSESADLIVARLLLPYVRIQGTLREIHRALKPGGVALFQLHSFGYYFYQMKRNIISPSSVFYYARPVLSGIMAACTGVQPGNRWFSETAMTVGMMNYWAKKEGLNPIWEGGFSSKPLVVCRKV